MPSASIAAKPTSKSQKVPSDPSSLSNKTNKRQIPDSQRSKLAELNQNIRGDSKDENSDNGCGIRMYGSIDGETTLRVTPETIRSLDKNKSNITTYLAEHLDAVDGYLELVGWSKNKHIPSSIYDKLFTSDLKIKRLALRGRGKWTSCQCPKEKSKFGEQIDAANKESTTQLVHLYVYRTFSITSCALLDLISRSPNLKTVRFYGVLDKIEGDHQSAFESVRFMCSLEGLYWPWFDRKYHASTLRLLVSRSDQLLTFYCDGETTCDFINSDKLLSVKHLSINLNENWSYHIPDDDEGMQAIIFDNDLTMEDKESKLTKRREKRYKKLCKSLPNRIEKLIHLTQLDKIEALEVRTYEIKFEEDEDDLDKNAHIIKQYETYQLKFWESVHKMRSLKYLAIFGAWELDKVARELAKHGLQIEYFKTNLMPISLMVGIKETTEEQPMDVDEEKKLLKLNLTDVIRHLVKLAKLKSIHFSCYEYLADFDLETKSSLKDLSDLIWQFDCRVSLTKTIDELLNQVLRRGNHQGRSYRIKMVVEPEDPAQAKFYLETVQKFSTNCTIKDKLVSIAQMECKQRFGKNSYKSLALWGFEQAGGRDFEQLRNVWETYNDHFRPIERFV